MTSQNSIHRGNLMIKYKLFLLLTFKFARNRFLLKSCDFIGCNK